MNNVYPESGVIAEGKVMLSKAVITSPGPPCTTGIEFFKTEPFKAGSLVLVIAGAPVMVAAKSGLCVVSSHKVQTPLTSTQLLGT